MKTILILGAGFGGLRAATKIAKKLKRLNLDKGCEIVLIDKNKRHTYTPLLYEVATTSKTTANTCRLYEIAAYDVRSLIGNLPIKFIQDEVLNLNIKDGFVKLKASGILAFDFLVFALGSEVNHFGIKGLKENSLPLKEFIDAIKIRDKIWSMAEERGRDFQRPENIRILIGGGGSTGVEIAGELKAWCGELAREFPKCSLDVEIVEAAPTVLYGFPEKIIKFVSKRLKKLGVKITAGKKIVDAKKNEVILDNGEKISFDLLVWSGGLKASSLLLETPLEREPRGRVVAKEEMLLCVPESAHLHIIPEIYGIGDSICFYNKTTGRPVPGVARAAISQADVAAHNLTEDIKASESRAANRKSRIYEPKHKKYKPWDYPYIIPVGGKWAIAKIGPFIISGFTGWILKGLVELNYLLSIMPPARAVKIWLKGLWIFVRNDRLG